MKVYAYFGLVDNKVKGCVHYIFASLFCMSKREHFWNKKKSFYFTSKALFVIEIIRLMSWHCQMPLHETRNILLNNLGSKDGDEIWLVYV